MKSWPLWVGLGVFLCGTGGYWEQTWLSKWAILVAIAVFTGCIQCAKKTSLWHLPLLIYVTGSLLLVGIWCPYQTLLDPVIVTSLRLTALMGLAQVCALILVTTWISYDTLPSIRRVLSIIWLIETMGLLTLPLIPHMNLFPWIAAHRAPDNGLWLGNPSMAGGLIAALVPLTWSMVEERWVKIVLWTVTLTAIISTQASVPWGVLGLTTATYLVSQGKLSWRCQTTTICALSLSMIFAGKLLLGTTFFDPNGRFEIWRMAWDYFRAHANPWVGFGFSTSQVFLPLEQVSTNHFHGAYFLWLHNDWLQILIEGGYIGLAVTLLSFSRLLYISWSVRSDLFACLCGLVTLGLFNYPLRMPVHSLCLVFVCSAIEVSHRRQLRLDRRGL